MDEGYEAELDFELLGDWCAFCRGNREFSTYHFSTLLMGVFLGGHTPEVDRFLREFTSAFPLLYPNLVRICIDDVSDRDVLPWIHRDLDEKRKLLHSSSEALEARAVIDARRFAFTHDRDLLQEVRGTSANGSVLYRTVNDFVADLCDGDDRLLALSETLYHIATDYDVANAIMAPLFKSEINLGHFFEVYLRGGDYVVDSDRILVYTYDPTQS